MFKSYVHFALLSFLSIPLLVFAQANCTNPVRDTCEFYSECLEGKYQCGNEGYPLNYGFHFCSKFSAAKSKLSTGGQKWLSDTMLCLQTALVPDVNGGPGASSSCDTLKEKAFATHADCYVDSGLCSLDISDWKKISVDIVGPGTLVESFDALKATAGVAIKCTGFFAKVIGDKIWPFKMKRERKSLLLE